MGYNKIFTSMSIFSNPDTKRTPHCTWLPR